MSRRSPRPRRALDRRLLERAGKARGALVLAGAASALDAVLLILAAALVAEVVATVVEDPGAHADVAGRVLLLLAAIGVRSILGSVMLALPQRAAAEVKLRLRAELVQVAATSGSRTAAPTGEVAAIAGRGLDALDSYFARYLPAIVRAATVPAAVWIAMIAQDLTAGLIVAATLPLIPIFGGLAGAYTERQNRRQWRVLAVLSHHFLDVVRGLPTLKVFGRAAAQASMIARVTEQYRIATMATLRIALLSALVLELAATISVALVAVSVGLRLVHGGIALQTALFLLVLVPEAYLPLRRAAAEYHAAAEGVAAAEHAFAVIGAAEPETTNPQPPIRTIPDPARAALVLDGVGVRFHDRDHAVLDDLSLVIPPGQVTAIVGPSGSGKSTVMRLLLGLRPPDQGMIRVGDTDLARIDLPRWHRRLAWLPQHPRLLSGSIVDNIALGRPGVLDDAVAVAAARAGISDLLAGERASGQAAGNGPQALSAGQWQRVALARVFLRTDASLVLLDEPTAHLDAATEQRISEALLDFAGGRTVVLITHRAAVRRLADHIIEMRPGSGDAPATRYHSAGAW